MGASIEAAVVALRKGGVVAYPTEAVWGLGCDPANAIAVDRLFRLKRRPSATGVLLIGAEYSHLSAYIGDCPDEAIQRAQATWPGPNTWVFPRASSVPEWIAGAHAGIALRLTAHPVARALCLAFGSAIVSTSANRHGEMPALTAAEVQRAFAGELDAVVDGELGGLERPTRIRDAISGEIVRN
jgi:L-threonylcarbamoyladenylate synthase